MQNQKIIDRITNELVEEIKTSEKNFSNEEIKEKINQKLIEYTLNSEENLLQKEKSEKEDSILKTEFTKIDDDNEDNNDFDFEIENNFDENDIDNNDVDNNTTEIEDKKDKKFFQEVKDIYKNEFKQSISCFSNVVDSMKLTSKTSLFELILVFLFLVIPAILAGCIAFLIVILLFIIWQIYLIIQTIYKLFEKAEFSIKDTINNIKIKIKNYKKSGGFINKLIFSNALYTLLMFNGVMYMLIKGLMLPVKSILDVEKILANIIAKIEKGITTVLKAPSELAVANIKSQNLKASKKSKGKDVEKDKKLNEKAKSKEKSQQKQEKIDEKAKYLHQTKNIELANAIAKSIKENIDKSSEKTILNKLNNENNELLKTPTDKLVSKEETNNKVVEKIAMSSSERSMPSLNTERKLDDIVLNVMNNLTDLFSKDISSDNKNPNINNKELSSSKILEQQRVDEAKQKMIDEMKKEVADLSEQLSNPSLSESQHEVIEDRIENIQENIKEVQEKEAHSMSELQQIKYDAEKNDHEQIIIKNDNPLIDGNEQEIIDFIDKNPNITREELDSGIKNICSDNGKNELSKADCDDIKAVVDGVMEEKEDTKEIDKDGMEHSFVNSIQQERGSDFTICM